MAQPLQKYAGHGIPLAPSIEASRTFFNRPPTDCRYQEPRKILKFLTVVVVASTVAAQSAIAIAISPSTEHWYNQIESTRKKGQDHPWVSAVIKGINLRTGEIMISHGPISHAKMPAMTMTFPVRDPANLTAYRVGDWVQIQ